MGEAPLQGSKADWQNWAAVRLDKIQDTQLNVNFRYIIHLLDVYPLFICSSNLTGHPMCVLADLTALVAVARGSLPYLGLSATAPRF